MYMYLILYIKRTLRQSVEHFWKICGKKKWENNSKGRNLDYINKTVNFSITAPKLYRYNEILFFRLRTGYIKLNRYLNKIGFTTSNLCDTCQQEEIVEHFLLHCKQYNVYRRNMIDHLLQLGVTDFKLTKLLSGNNFQPVVDYINATNRF